MYLRQPPGSTYEGEPGAEGGGEGEGGNEEVQSLGMTCFSGGCGNGRRSRYMV